MRVPDRLQYAGLEKILYREHQEQRYEIEAIEGAIPAFVRGTYFLAQPDSNVTECGSGTGWTGRNGLLAPIPQLFHAVEMRRSCSRIFCWLVRP